MTMITRTVHSLEAQQIIKDALAANSVEMKIEAQGSEHFVTYSVTLEPGQVAYSAYRISRGGKAHDGTPLPVALPDDLMPAWGAFSAAIMTGCGVDQAYQRYLTERSGLAVAGGTAPDWDELRNTKPDIAAAWADAANALTAAL
jgi:hypothetical protein